MAITAAQLNVKIGTEGAARAKSDIASVGDAVDKADGRSRMLGAGLLGMGGLIGGVFATGAVAAIDFGEQMANVNSIAQLTTAELNAVSEQVLELASVSGQAPTTLAEGLYDIYSSGFQGAEGLQVLEASAYAANAGLTTTATSARAITAVLNAYGLEATDAAHVSDVLFQAVNEGVITFDQLSANMGNTLPIANSLGISIEELAAGYALMTLNGVPASQAETQLASLMRAAINPTDALTTAVQDYGYASVESLIATEGMSGYLDLLTKASGGTTEGLFELLGTAEATNAALLLGGENADEYAASVDRMEKSSEGLGATQTALAKQMESTAFSLKLLKTNLQAAAIAIGVQLEPVIKAVAKGLTTLIKGFLKLSKPVQQVIGVVTALAGVLALVAGGVILFGSQIAAAGALFVSLLGPIGLIVAAVVGLYAAWQTNLFGIRDIASDVFGGIMDFISPVTDFLGRFMDAWNGPSDVMDQINAWGGLNADGTTKSVMDQINAWGGLTEEMTLAQRAMAAFDVATGGALTRLQAMSVGDVVVTIGGWIVNAGKDLGLAVWDWMTDTAIPAIGSFIQDLPGIVVNIGDWIKGEVADLWDTVMGWFSGGGSSTDMLAGGGGYAGGQSIDLGGILVNIGDWIKGTIPAIWDKVQSWAKSAWDAVSSSAVAIGGVLVNIASYDAGDFLAPIDNYITKAVTDAYAGYVAAGVAPKLDKVPVEISGFDVTVQDGTFADSLPDTPSESETAAAYDKGFKFGFVPAQKFIDGVNAGMDGAIGFFSASGGGEGNGLGGGGAGGGGGSPFTNLVASILGGFNGAITAISNGMRDIPMKFAREVAGPALNNMFGANAPLWAPFKKIKFPDITIPDPKFTWPDAPSINDVPFVTDFIVLVGTISTTISNLSWSFGIPMPSLSWPSTDDIMALAPDWVTDFAGWLTGQMGGSGEDPGNGTPVLGGSGGGGMGPLPSALPDLAPFRTSALEVQTISETTADAMKLAFSTPLDVSGITTGLAQITTAVSNIGPLVTVAALSVGSALVSGIVGGITLTAGRVTTAITAIVTTAGNAKLGMTLAGLGAGMAFGTAAAAGVNLSSGKVGTAVSALVAIASGYKLRMMGAGMSIGIALGVGIAAGINSQVGAIASAAASAVSSAIGAARSAGGIKSPSKVMHDQVGRMLGLGVEEGIYASIPGVQRASAGLVPSLSGSFAGSGGNNNIMQNSSQGGGVTVNVTIQGSVTGEAELLGRFASAIGDEVNRHRVASGVMN